MLLLFMVILIKLVILDTNNSNMKFFKPLLCLAMLFMSMTISAQEKAYYPDPNPVIQQRLEEWQDLKFGLLRCCHQLS